MPVWITTPKQAAAFLLAATIISNASADQMPGMSAQDHATMHHGSGQIESTPLQGNSIFQIRAPLLGQSGGPLNLEQLHATAILLTMFYGDCQYACPIIIENLKRTVAALPETQRQKLNVVMISLNAGIDTPEKLRALMKTNQLDPKRFTLAVAGNDADTRQWAAVLGVKYRKAANGDINHSTRMVLVDKSGIPVATSDALSADPDPAFLEKIKSAVQ